MKIGTTCFIFFPSNACSIQREYFPTQAQIYQERYVEREKMQRILRGPERRKATSRNPSVENDTDPDYDELSYDSFIGFDELLQHSVPHRSTKSSSSSSPADGAGRHRRTVPYHADASVASVENGPVSPIRVASVPKIPRRGKNMSIPSSQENRARSIDKSSLGFGSLSDAVSSQASSSLNTLQSSTDTELSIFTSSNVMKPSSVNTVEKRSPESSASSFSI